MSQSLQIDIFRRIVDSEQANLSKAAARSLVALAFSDDDRERMNELAEKARDGSLTEAENAELDDFIHVGNMLAILKSKARRALKMVAVRR